MLKKLHRAVAHMVSADSQPRTVDAAYDRAKANWTILHNVLLDVRRQIEAYRASMEGLCTASSAAVDALALLFPQPSASSVSISASGAAAALPVAPQASHPYSPLAHSTCGELLDKFGALRLRLNERDELLEELEHYSSKTAGLRRDRDKLLAAGRKETVKEEERRLRNEDNTLKLRADFVAINAALTSELTAYWDSRLDLLTPILLDFFTAQHKFASELGECATDIARLREATLKTAPPVDFSAVLHEITLAADLPERHCPRRHSASSTSTPNQSRLEASRTDHSHHHHSPTLAPAHPAAAPPSLTHTPTSTAAPPPLPVAAISTPVVLPQPALTIMPTAATVSPAPSPTSARTMPAITAAAVTATPAAATPNPAPVAGQVAPPVAAATTTPATPPAVPARPQLPLRKHVYATMQAPLSSQTASSSPSSAASSAPVSQGSSAVGAGPAPAASGSGLPPPPPPTTVAPPPLPPMGPSVAARIAAAAIAPSAAPPFAAAPASAPAPTPPPPVAIPTAASTSAASASASASAAAQLDASYDRALRAVAAPQFVAPSRSVGPPPLPPSGGEPEPWPRAIAGQFDQMHKQALAEMEMLGALPAPCQTP